MARLAERLSRAIHALSPLFGGQLRGGLVLQKRQGQKQPEGLKSLGPSSSSIKQGQRSSFCLPPSMFFRS